MTRTRALWRAVYKQYPCPTCGAKRGEECTTRKGKPSSGMHVKRTQHGDRCPRCGADVTDADLPGSYCAKCQLLRALEVERATLHRRVT
jgi:hypothetical protein